MRASNARNLCRLSSLFRSSTSKLNTSELQSYPLASSISEDVFSELDSEPKSTRAVLDFERDSDSESLHNLVPKHISSILSVSAEVTAPKKLSKGQIRKSPKVKLSPRGSSILEDDFSELDSEPKPSSFKDFGLAPLACSENLPDQASKQISSMLCDSQLVKGLDDDVKKLESALELPWLFSTCCGNISQRQKEKTREKKQKWVFKSTQGNRFESVVKFCANKLGAGAAMEIFNKLGKETGMKEYNALIEVCINKARATNDIEMAIEEMGQAFHLFKVMRELGYQLEERTYSPLLLYLIDMGMVEEFQYFSKMIKDENSSSVSRMGYYEMMLWLRVDNEEKIRDLCNSIAVNDGIDTSGLGESYLLAFCESDWKEGLLQLLAIMDITKLSSVKSITTVFESLGRLRLELVAKKFLLAFKMCDHEANNITDFIACYVVNIPNLAVEDVILKFKDLHQILEVSPSSSSYEKLIMCACDLLEVHGALKIIYEMCEDGFTLSTEVLNSTLRICEETCEYNLVHWIYSMISHYSLKANCETFRCMINLCVRMKEFESAYKMLDDLEEMNLKPTAGMYNAIMAGYFREKNNNGALRVLEHMKDANVKPDSMTFSCLIGNSKTKEDIAKYYEEMKQSQNQFTKQFFMSLVNAYAACGEFEKAKQVVLDPSIPPKSLNEVKSALLSALASHEQLSESTLTYEEIKNSGNNPEPKAVISLIEAHINSDGELDRLFLLLEELSDTDYWIDGCFRIIMLCVKNKHLRAGDLIQQLKDKFHDDELLMEVLLDQVFSTIASLESSHLEFGLKLFWHIREVLGILPSRQCLDFLLIACANAKDLGNVHRIWKEYEVAEYPYNVVSYVRMYRALLALGDHESAKSKLKEIPGDDEEIPRDDPHVCDIIKACQKMYANPNLVKGTRKKQKNKKELV